MLDLSCWLRIENLSNVLGFSILCSYILFVWFNTNAFVEYINLFNLSRFFKISQYNEVVKVGYPDNYLSFLREYFYDAFLVRLVTCPVCLGFWLSIAVAALTDSSILLLPLTLIFYILLNRLSKWL
jgi:hypothetical protein